MLSVVSGIGHELNLIPFSDVPKDRELRRRGTDFRLQNTFNVKSYIYRVVTSETLLGGELKAHQTWSGEGGVSWTSPKERVALDWSATLNDSQNHSESGPFAEFASDPIPNRSRFGKSWAVQVLFENVLIARDRIEPFYQGRYTEGFFRSWESQGITEFKDRVQDQVSHDAGITYSNQIRRTRLTNTFEVQNLADAPLFDNFGVQKPGRAFYFKISAETW